LLRSRAGGKWCASTTYEQIEARFKMEVTQNEQSRTWREPNPLG
jgi:hypothetical protein